MAIVKVRNWGRVLCFTIPSAYAKVYNIIEGDIYDVDIKRNAIVYTPLDKIKLNKWRVQTIKRQGRIQDTEGGTE